MSEKQIVTQRAVYACLNCGSTKVEVQAWVKPNEGDIFVSYVDDGSSYLKGYCHKCEGNFEVEEVWMK
jgi:hypothetical protein